MRCLDEIYMRFDLLASGPALYSQERVIMREAARTLLSLKERVTSEKRKSELLSNLTV